MRIFNTIIFIAFLFVWYANGYAQSIKITKENQKDPTDVCDLSTYKYIATITDLPPGVNVSVTWTPTNGETSESGNSSTKVKWKATSSTDGNLGKIKASFTYNNNTYSDEFGVTIKSIQHIKAEIPMFYGITNYPIEPCSSGTMYLAAANMKMPVTDELVVNYRWKIPSGWSIGGHTSNGTDWIYSGQNVTASYPASVTGGTIEVQGSIIGCYADTQFSKTSDPVTVSRTKSFTLTPNKKYLLCGDTSPVTFTVSPALSCATYYWNGSQTASTSNTCQITPDGSSPVTVSVNIFYGGTSEAKTKTVNYYMFSKSNPPYIQGPPQVCPGGSSFSVSNLRSGQTVIYTPSTNISKTQTGNTCTLYSSSTGTGYLDATIHTNCGDTVIARKPLDVGSPQPGNIYIEMDAPPRRFTATIQNEVASATSYDWYLDGVLNTTYHGFSAIFNRKSPYCGREYHLEVRANNGCGSSAKTHKLVFEPDCLYRLVLSPNPTVDESTVELFDESTTTLTSEMDWELEVYDQNQMLKEKKTRIKGNLTKIRTSNWKDGIYYLRAYYNNEWISEKLVVKH